MILAGRLLDPDVERPAIGWLRIEGGIIVERGDGEAPPGAIGGDQCVVTPGFVDAHLHLPQFDAIGCHGLELLTWLRTVIYPAERRWADEVVARAQIDTAHERLLREGTVAYAGYLTSHGTGVDSLCTTDARRPRAVVGQVRMDREAPDDLIGHPVIVTPADTPSLRWSVNPRFAVACSREALAQAGRDAGPTTIIQTHHAETRLECERVHALFPEAENYVSIYDTSGLLRPTTLLAHGIHATDDELALIAQRGATIVHCPTANVFLEAGMLDLARVRDAGVRLALGSDVAAGADIAMPVVARAMIDLAVCRRMSGDAAAYVPSPVEAWRMITRDNAIALGMDDLGTLEPGGAASLLLLRPTVPADEHLHGRLLYNWTARWIDTMVVDGRVVTGPSTQDRR